MKQYVTLEKIQDTKKIKKHNKKIKKSEVTKKDLGLTENAKILLE